jgi:hypothetical protein
MVTVTVKMMKMLLAEMQQQQHSALSVMVKTRLQFDDDVWMSVARCNNNRVAVAPPVV